MNLKTFLRNLQTLEAKEEFASRCGTTFEYLKQVAYGGKPCGIQLAVNLERESNGDLVRERLRPNDWWKIWPELAERTPVPEDAA